MGFYPPILFNSAKTAKASLSGLIDPNLDEMTSKASTTLGVDSYLALNFKLSSSLVDLKISSCSSKIANYLVLFSISASSYSMD